MLKRNFRRRIRNVLRWSAGLASLALAVGTGVGAADSSGGAVAADTRREIREAGYVEIGGIRQWVTIRGDDRSNPVVLFVHGGPGNPMSLYADSLYPTWEGKFTLVQWDQRGAGKTAEANLPPGEVTPELIRSTPLSLELIAQDGIEIAEYLRTKFHQPNVILTGTSWGSAVAVTMLAKKPELFQFYVGVSQLVNYDENVASSFEEVRARVVEQGDKKTLQNLDTIGRPPWTGPKGFGALRRISRRLESEVTDHPLQLIKGSDYSTESYHAAYELGEDLSYVKFAGLKGDGFARSVALDRDAHELKIPVYFIQGKEDLLTSAKITRRYYEQLTAPHKSYTELPRSGHDPNDDMLKAQYEALLEGLKH